MLLLPTRNLVRESRQPRRARVWRSVGARTKAAALRLLEAREEDTPPSAPLDSPSGIVAKNGRSSGDARRLGERCKQTCVEPRGVVVQSIRPDSYRGKSNEEKVPARSVVAKSKCSENDFGLRFHPLFVAILPASAFTWWQPKGYCNATN